MNKKIISSAAAVIIFAVILAFAVVPAAQTAAVNGKDAKCLNNMYALKDKLEYFLNGTESNEFWYDLISEKNSQKLINALNEQLDKKIDTSSYYIKFSEWSLTILCRRHPAELSIIVNIPNNFIAYKNEFDEPATDMILYLEAYGRDIYFQNTILDESNPNKKVFTSSDNLTELFPDIKVTAHYAGGGERLLNSDEYRLYASELDMTKSGEKTLCVSAAGQDWRSDLFTTFEIYVLDNEEREPLVVDGGNFGTYELASWVWTDYVADALDTYDDYMEFDASIVFDGGSYYYYPDGFAIIKASENNGTIKGAVDLDNHSKEAYHIKFNTNKVVNGSDISVSSMKDGYMKVSANDKVYIWQTTASKDQPKGWIEVYCEKKKLN
ncbi:MAG: hypothetical protein LUD03_06750 [Firmicutes bacterium]|nr:hypothetical protein [Bacillota bacterium]